MLDCWKAGIAAVAGLTLLAGCATSPQRVGGTPRSQGGPALVVLISIDQLRADQPLALLSRFGSGGFRRLYERGVVYDQAHYAHSATETAPGHATLGTGALPKEHGIVGNEWSEHGHRIYAVEDLSQELIGGTSRGISSARLLAQTVGDVLARDRPQALLRSVSGKERSAVLMAGEHARVYWLDDGSGTFVSSRAFMPTLPAWVRSFGDERASERYDDERWILFSPESEYRASPGHAWEATRGCPALGCSFPHVIQGLTGEHFTKALKTTPFGDALTLSFVRSMLENEPLGQDAVSDLLTISFSSTDYIGHTFGPESREAEDNLLWLDRTLAALFELLDARVGHDRYVVLLTSDHGACESPEFLQAQGLDAGRVDSALLLQTVGEGLRARFDVGVDLVREFINPSIVLNEQRIASLSLDVGEVERAAAELARSVPGVWGAFARSDILAGKADAGELQQRIEASTHAQRSGHVYVVPRPHWLLASPPARLIAMHGTPWPYDSHVPIVVLGTGAPAQHVARPVDPRDIAPTMAALLRIAPPAQSSGQVLREAMP